MSKVLIIINPTAGKMKSKGAVFDIISRFCAAGWQVGVQTTLRRGHAVEIAEKASEEFDLLVCAGGDGTLNETITGLMRGGRHIPLGYIPCGSTNDFANSMGISTVLKKAVDNIIIANDPVEVDIGRFGDRYFSYIASFGAFTSASYSTPQERKNSLGHFAYVLEGIKDISSFQSYHIKVSAGGVNVEDDYIFGAVSNSTSVGGIVKLDRGIVDVTDGLFEVILVRRPKNPVELSRIIHGVTFSDFGDEMFRFFKTPEITFEMEDAIPWTLDGEYAAGGEKVTVTNLPRALSIRK